MQGTLIKHWNSAMDILERDNPQAIKQKYPRLSPFGTCCGLSYTFLSHASRDDLAAFYSYINFITQHSAREIAQKLKENNNYTNGLYRFITMVASLQKNQSTLTEFNNQLTEASSVSRINNHAQSESSVEVISNQRSTINLLEKLAENEGFGLFAEAHAYGIYRTKSTWIVFDSNSSWEEFSSVQKAARKLLDVLEFNAISYSFAKMTTMNEFVKSILYILNKCANLFRHEKILSSPISLTSTAIAFDKAAEGRELSDRRTHATLFKNISGKNNAESMAIKAIVVNDGALLKSTIEKYRLDVTKPWQVWHGNANKKSLPLLEAARSNSVDALKVLISLNANINAVDQYGNNALFYAIKNNNEYIVTLLLEHSADPNLLNNEGQSSLGLAQQSGNAEIAKMLNRDAHNWYNTKAAA